MVHSPVVFRRFAGRRQHIDDLRARYRAAVEGSGSTVLIVGDAGIGKSRLAAEFCRAGDGDGALVVKGQCFEYLQIPYAPFLSIHRGLNGVDLVPQAGKWAQFEAIAQSLIEVAKRNPVIVVVEDLQWADPDSLELFAHVAGSIAAARVLILATVRAEEARRSDELMATLGKLARIPSVARLNLGPIDDADIQALIHEILDRDRPLTMQMVNAVRERAEGNPLYAEELLRTLLESGGAAFVRRSDFPSSVEQIVLARFQRCDEATRDVLERAAVIGRCFDVDFLALITEQPSARVLEALKRARTQQLVVEERDAAGSYAFRHSLTREAIVSHLLSAQARALHAKIAAAIESAPEADKRATALAYHWWEAGLPAKAAAYNERAGDDAETMFAHASAIELYERAAAAPELTADRRGSLYRKLAMALHHAGSAAKAREAFAHALALLPLGALYLEAGHLEFNTGDVERARILFEQGLAAAKGSDDVLWFNAHVSLAGLHVFLDAAQSALAHLAQAECYAGDRPAAEESRFHQFRAIALIAEGEVVEAVASCGRAVEIAQRAGDAEGAVRALGNVAVNLGKLGARAATLEIFERAHAIIKAHRLRSVSASFCLMQYALTCYRLGKLELAQELVTHALAMEIELKKFDVVAGRVGIAVGLLRLDDELVERSARHDFFELIEGIDDSAVPYAACAYIDYCVARGRFDGARGIIDRTLESLERLRDKQTDNVIFVHIAVHGDAAQIARARELLARLGELAQGVREHDAVAYLTLFDARLAQRENRATDARQLGERAAEQFRGLGWQLYEAQALETAGAREAALELYRRIGDMRDAQRLETSARRRGRPRASGPQGLSPRELEVARFISDGRSNRAISEALVIGERTVESHASAILNKLGLASRAELIAHMARAGAGQV